MSRKVPMTAVEMGHKAGRSRSPAKVRAARLNGRKGGRPKQTRAR